MLSITWCPCWNTLGSKVIRPNHRLASARAPRLKAAPAKVEAPAATVCDPEAASGLGDRPLVNPSPADPYPLEGAGWGLGAFSRAPLPGSTGRGWPASLAAGCAVCAAPPSVLVFAPVSPGAAC